MVRHAGLTVCRVFAWTHKHSRHPIFGAGDQQPHLNATVVANHHHPRQLETLFECCYLTDYRFRIRSIALERFDRHRSTLAITQKTEVDLLLAFFDLENNRNWPSIKRFSFIAPIPLSIAISKSGFCVIQPLIQQQRIVEFICQACFIVNLIMLDK